MMGSQTETLSQREREGPAAKRWEGEGLRPHRRAGTPSDAFTPHPPTLRAGPSLSPPGEGFGVRS
jgi:hypothetical protein